MKEKFVICFIISSLCFSGFLGTLWAQDEAPLANYGYGGTLDPGKIIVSSFMSGPAFELNMYDYDFGEVEPATPYIMDHGLHIENTGGVNLDFNLYSIDAYTGWLLNVRTTTAVENYFSLYALAGDPGDTLNPPTESDFHNPSLIANQIGFEHPYKEINSNQFYNPSWSAIPGITASGLNLPAEVPGEPTADEFSLFLRLLTPSWSTMDAFQVMQVTIEARIAE